MKWVKSENNPNEVRLSFYEACRGTEQDEAIKWCSLNKIKVEWAGFNYIRFSNDEDLAWFLLRWT